MHKYKCLFLLLIAYKAEARELYIDTASNGYDALHNGETHYNKINSKVTYVPAINVMIPSP